MATSCNIRVIARFRPLNSREKAQEKDQVVCQFPQDTQIIMTNNGNQVPFQFDRVFPPDTQQEEIFETVKSTVDDVLNGYNGTIFAYGQTGSGKTFTMFGSDDKEPEFAGIIPRTNVHIFNRIADDTTGTEFTIKCSFVEIYMENIKDLLNPKNTNLKIRESKTNGIWIEGLTEEFVGDDQEILDLIALGEQSRSVSKTNMNQRSSRSHSLLILTIEQKSRDGSIKRGKLNLVDLAGSEKVAKTGAEGQTLEEAKKINQSLSLLGNCIHALTESKRDHIPFRDSKLTRILQESLGGNTKTTLMVTASPHISNVEETISTLKFGARAKTIKNNVKINQQKSAAELLAIISVLTNELSSLKHYSLSLEKRIEYMRSPDYVPGSPLPELATLAPSSSTSTPTLQSSTPSATQSNNSSSSATTKPRPPSQLGAGSPFVGQHSRNNSSNSSRSQSPENNVPSLYDPMAMVELTMQIDRLKEENQLLVDKFKDELSELTLQMEYRSEELIQVRAQLEAAKDLAKHTGQETKTHRETERNLTTELQNRDIRVSTLTQQVEDLQLLASQVVQYLDRKQQTDYLEGDANSNEGRLCRSVSSTSLSDDGSAYSSDTLQDINIEEVIRNLSEEELLSMQIKMQLQNRIAQLEQRQQQLSDDLASSEASLTSLQIHLATVEKERNGLQIKLQSMIDSRAVITNGAHHAGGDDAAALQLLLDDGEPDGTSLETRNKQLRVQLEHTLSDKRSLDQYNEQLQSENSALKERELRLMQEIKALKSGQTVVQQEFALFKEDAAMKSKLQYSQITNLQAEVQSVQSKLHNEKQNKQKVQNEQIEISSKTNELFKIHEDREHILKMDLERMAAENDSLQLQYQNMVDKCQDLQNELTATQRMLANRRLVRVVRSDEKAVKRAWETKEEFGQHTLKKTGVRLF
ncbi:hypothetical protein SAMD00019534_096130 [Acytostelium subglobosum LB1]|uniref:hypothetical protein n=1 Tax=Acytostelium subglobosum LB1 TaxID=1410327 RepID=UPI0006449C1F|nr:hypothetical protein SAMD00019534_096130 [Acytostelium subglobosum LB1]GAM26438.1 hypothetical protein SAMD00019534_096130 [Acytostelium subglobosum LB1]|eukprot:XP_012750534.1 hypothetical protein SAMD00019534_096130 [Acytostelium subglobosum LB1]